MPYAAKRPCGKHGCPAFATLRGRCDAHQLPLDVRGKTRKKKYDKQAWRGPRGVRQAKLRENPFCEDCKERNEIVLATDVDHEDGDSENDAWENLRSRCHSCHSSKTATQDGGFGNPKVGVGKGGSKL